MKNKIKLEIRLISLGASLAVLAFLLYFLAELSPGLSPFTEIQTLASTIDIDITQVALGMFLLAAAIMLFASSRLTYLVMPKVQAQIIKADSKLVHLKGSYELTRSTLDAQTEALKQSKEELKVLRRESQRVKQALQHSEQRFRTLFDESPVLFLAINHKQVIIDINHYGANKLGYNFLTLVGKPFVKIAEKNSAYRLSKFVSQLFERESNFAEIDFKLKTKEEDIVWFKAACSVVKESGKRDYVIMVCQDITDSKNLADTLSFQATHDDLTKLHNRRALESYLTNVLEIKDHQKDEPSALIYLDIDQLKVVNDTCGHIAGDTLINQLVSVIAHLNIPFDFFARVGGDEFAIVKDNTSRIEALALAELIRSAAEEFSFTWENKSFGHSVSIGVALSSEKIRSLTDIFGAADSACYVAKEAGRNRVVFHEDSCQSERDSRHGMLWVSRLRNALSKDRFELHFQPIVSLQNPAHKYIHYEVLLRYIDDDGTVISPNDFFPAAERFGLSHQIDLWVVTKTLEFLRENSQHTRALDCCSINLTSNSLSSESTRRTIKQMVRESNFPTNKICFEITETSAIKNLREATAFIQDLRILGCKFALDDFGTGFSSFGYLKNLQVDFIKIDGSFIKDINRESIDRAMVKAIHTMGQEMQIATIAEYVADEFILHELKGLNVQYGQGFGLSKPMPMSYVNDFYHHNTGEEEYKTA